MYNKIYEVKEIERLSKAFRATCLPYILKFIELYQGVVNKKT